MVVHDISYVRNYISFPKALLLVAERLFLSQICSPTQWARWMKSLDTADVEESRLLTDREQLAKQDKAECSLFLMTVVAEFMRGLLVKNELPAYINAGSDGLFRADPTIFEDNYLLTALIMNNATVTAHAACWCQILGTWENAYNYVKSGRIVFCRREIERALNSALTLSVVGNDNSAPSVIIQATSIEPNTIFGQSCIVLEEPAPEMMPSEIASESVGAFLPFVELKAGDPPPPKNRGAQRAYNYVTLGELADRAIKGDFGRIKSFSALCRSIVLNMPTRPVDINLATDSIRHITFLKEKWNEFIYLEQKQINN